MMAEAALSKFKGEVQSSQVLLSMASVLMALSTVLIDSSRLSIIFVQCPKFMAKLMDVLNCPFKYPVE
jgi:hypothetical protein